MVVSYFMDYNYWVPLISEISKNINFSPKLYFLYFSIPFLRNKRELLDFSVGGRKLLLTLIHCSTKNVNF